MAKKAKRTRAAEDACRRRRCRIPAVDDDPDGADHHGGGPIRPMVRVMVSLGPYSGQGTPSKYGDYEAQRHWMEITLHTPASER
ncbi:putative dolichyl pyrophosphate Man9GlcNAc2 alpha-1,3-glucosyltransferase [Cocos nucifera]|nr:putative dolichyl pyrophosphate Man9GlcNAc2 alpha-1,3-glucosyltransferase [Cocos nucifera]